MTPDNLDKFLSDLEGRAFNPEILNANSKTLYPEDEYDYSEWYRLITARNSGARWQHAQDQRTIRLLCEVVRAHGDALNYYELLFGKLSPELDARIGGGRAGLTGKTVAKLIAEYEANKC